MAMIGPAHRALALEAGLIVLCLTALASQSGVKLAVVNESPSLPEGLYLRAPFAEPALGAVVAVSPPPVARPYLAQLGLPPGALLLKRVAAIEGDLVCVRDHRLATPRRTVEVLAADRRGRPLPVWSGCSRLGPGEVFLLGDSRASFDSRYFGPVRVSSLAGVFQQAALW